MANRGSNKPKKTAEMSEIGLEKAGSKEEAINHTEQELAKMKKELDSKAEKGAEENEKGAEELTNAERAEYKAELDAAGIDSEKVENNPFGVDGLALTRAINEESKLS